MNSFDYYMDGSEDREPPKKKKFFNIFVVVAFLFGGGFLINTTLAANISLNSGGAVEFGQGVSQTVACSGNSSLTVTPNATFVNASGAGAHYFSSVTISGVPSGCYGKDFTLNAYGTSSSTPLAIFNTASTSPVVYNNSGVFQLVGNSTGMSISSGPESFTVTFATPVATSASVFKVTIQSSAHIACALGGSCAVGDIGPGGGLVFYNAGSVQSWGQYLEAAPKTWSGGSSDATSNWCSVSANITGTTTSIGAGKANTALMVAGCSGTSGAKTVAALTLGGKSDWFVPSSGEAQEFYTQRALFTGSYALSGDGVNTDPTRYLSSSQHPTLPADHFYYVKWFNGAAEQGAKSYSGWSLRPIRSF
jgi:hypothetical protein